LRPARAEASAVHRGNFREKPDFFADFLLGAAYEALEQVGFPGPPAVRSACKSVGPPATSVAIHLELQGFRVALGVEAEEAK
jgi:hypothetical protein